MNTESSRNNELGINTSTVWLCKQNGLNKDTERVFRVKIKGKRSVAFFQDCMIVHLPHCNKPRQKIHFTLHLEVCSYQRTTRTAVMLKMIYYSQ
jgi:hypothetical protein